MNLDFIGKGKINLGDLVKDKYSKLTGVLYGVCLYLHEKPTACIIKESGEAAWLDFDRIELVKSLEEQPSSKPISVNKKTKVKSSNVKAIEEVDDDADEETYEEIEIEEDEDLDIEEEVDDEEDENEISLSDVQTAFKAYHKKIMSKHKDKSKGILLARNETTKILKKLKAKNVESIKKDQYKLALKLLK